MKSLLCLLALFSVSAFAKQTSTECTFKKNPKNKVYLDFTYNGHQLDTAKVMLIIQASGKGRDFTYYNYAFMQDAMNYQEYIPFGRRAEVVNFVDSLEQSGKYSFRVVNYGATTSSVEFAAKSVLKRSSGQITFDAVLKTILKTENITALENGKSLTLNEVTCIQRML